MDRRFLPSKYIAIRVGDLDPSQHPEMHYDRFSRFCDRLTDRSRYSDGDAVRDIDLGGPQ